MGCPALDAAGGAAHPLWSGAVRSGPRPCRHKGEGRQGSTEQYRAESSAGGRYGCTERRGLSLPCRSRNPACSCAPSTLLYWRAAALLYCAVLLYHCPAVLPPLLQNVINQFTQLAQDPRLAFLGNVRVGQDLSLAELRAHYNAVVLSYGAESDRRLGVPGEVGAGLGMG
jgi:hypothetical protein